MLPAAIHTAWKSMVEAEKAARTQGAHFAERVRREKLSIDHAIILEWENLKKWYAYYEWKWPFEATRAEAVKRWRNDCLSFGVAASRETTERSDFESYCNSLLKERK